MIPWNLLGRTTTPGGDQLALMHQPGEFLILAGGKPLMSSRMHGSEEAMAEMACRGRRERRVAHRAGRRPRHGLHACGPRSTRCRRRRPWSWPSWWPASWSGIAVLWDTLANHPLKDRRVQVEVTPVDQLLKATKTRFDVVQLDVDNGPSAFTTEANGWLYTDSGSGRHEARAERRRHAGGVVGPGRSPLRAAPQARRLRGERRAGAGAPEEGWAASRDLRGAAERRPPVARR